LKKIIQFEVEQTVSLTWTNIVETGRRLPFTRHENKLFTQFKYDVSII